MTVKTCQLIIYACPVGPLAEQLELYFRKSRLLCGPNKAHNYMPHCSLTGFFQDDPANAQNYVEQLERCYKHHWTGAFKHPIRVKGLEFKADWHGLSLYAPELKQMVRQFAETSLSPTRQEEIRTKSWLHLSLAYGFQESEAKRLESLAQSLVNPEADVTWELRFYRKNKGNGWLCYHQWEL